MREVAEILSLTPQELASPFTVTDRTVDETQLELKTSELDHLEEVTHASLDALAQLQEKSNHFAEEVEQLSNTMSSLESQSSVLHHKLLRREEALTLVDPLLQQFLPSAQDIDTIFEKKLNSSWFGALERVRKPLELPPNFTNEPPLKSLEGAQKLRRVVISYAIERVKTLVVTNLRVLRRPGVNSQMVQLELLDAKPALELLNSQTPRLASTLGHAYRNTMKWYYTMLFGKYGRWLGRQPIATQDQPKLLGSAVTRTSTGFFGLGSSELRDLDSFSVGTRPAILNNSLVSLSQATDSSELNTSHDFSTSKVHTPRVPSRAASPANSVASTVTSARNYPVAAGEESVLPMTAVPSAASPQYPIEVLVRSLLVTLNDSFGMEAQMAKCIGDGKVSFVEVFQPTLDFYAEVLGLWVTQSSGDLFGLLVVIRLAQQQANLQRWAPAWLKTHVYQRVWPLIISICNQQALSIEAAALKVSTTGSNLNHGSAQKSSAPGPHILTQLVSSFLSGILQLCPGEPEQDLKRNVQAIVESYELFISKLASGEERILHSNYFVVAALLSDIDGQLASEISNHFQLLVDAYHA